MRLVIWSRPNEWMEAFSANSESLTLVPHVMVQRRDRLAQRVFGYVRYWSSVAV